MFSIGEAVVCVDAADIPTPPWKPLECGKSYVIRDIIKRGDNPDFMYDKNIHKKAQHSLLLWGISNILHPIHHIELGYAETRFEKIDSLKNEDHTKENVKKPEKIRM